MNNLKYYNDSLAYDFDLFMPSEAKPKQPEKDNIIPMPRERQERSRATRKAARRLNSTVFAVVVSAVMVTALCLNIALRIRVNELSTQVNRAQSKLATAKSESVSLQMEYESRVSYSNLEAEASALGMKKLNKDQVVYIRVSDQCVAKNATGETMVASR